MLMWRWAPLPAVLALSLGRKLAVSLCLAAMPQIASLVYSSPSVAYTAAPQSTSCPSSPQIPGCDDDNKVQL